MDRSPNKSTNEVLHTCTVEEKIEFERFTRYTYYQKKTSTPHRKIQKNRGPGQFHFKLEKTNTKNKNPIPSLQELSGGFDMNGDEHRSYFMIDKNVTNSTESPIESSIKNPTEYSVNNSTESPIESSIKNPTESEYSVNNPIESSIKNPTESCDNSLLNSANETHNVRPNNSSKMTFDFVCTNKMAIEYIMD